MGQPKKQENLLHDTLKKGEKAERRKEASSKSEKEDGEQENNSDNHQQNCNRHKEPDLLKRNDTDKPMVG